MTALRKILALLTPAEKKRGLLVLVLVIGLALLETAGVASIMPFLAVLSNPEIIQEQQLLNSLYTRLNFASPDSFLFALGVASFALIIFGAIFRTGTQYAMYRYTEMRRHSISYRLLETYLRQPYEFFLNRHSGDLSKSILSEVDELIGKVFRPLLNLFAYSIVILAIIGLLVFVDPVLAIVMGLFIGGAYTLIFTAIRGYLRRLGIARTEANRERYTIAGEALGGIKDIKLLGREYAYLSRFRAPSTLLARYQATNAVVANVPKYLIEAIGFGGIIALTLYLMATRDGLGDVIPLLGLYAFGAYRLLPSAQQIYASLAQMRFGMGAVDEVYKDLKERESLAEIIKEDRAPLVPKKTIHIDSVTFAYPNAAEPALVDLDLKIPVGTSVGIIGTTGAGKTTAVDLILGLLRPTKGMIRVDGEPITEENLRNWQNSIGYVPQDIFLIDASIAENIALGVPPDEIDQDRVQTAAQMAQIHDFITTELPDAYQTTVGERGVRLSGGQRQRIGIARALYHEPPILVFDEATSALDNATEAELMEAITALQGQKTMLMIAHRLSTVANCDQILILKDGQLHATGTYTHLLNTNTEFQRLAEARAS